MLLLCAELNIFQSHLETCFFDPSNPFVKQVGHVAICPENKVSERVPCPKLPYELDPVLLTLTPVTFTFCLNFDCVG